MMVVTSIRKGSFSPSGASVIEVVSGGLASLSWLISVYELPGAVTSTEELNLESPLSLGLTP